jgi:hypothetical protein
MGGSQWHFPVGIRVRGQFTGEGENSVSVCYRFK